MTARQLSQNVWVEDDVRGANHSFVVTSEGLVLFDVPVDINDARAWREAMRPHGEPRYIVNSEFHLDHNMNNHLFDCPVIASDITRQIVVEANNERWLRKQGANLYAEPIETPTQAEYERGWPSITFNDRMTLRLGSHTFIIMCLPGHTPGETAVYVPEEKLMFVADQVGTRGGAALHDGLPDQWIASLQVLKQFDIETMLVGHGKVVQGKDKIMQLIDQQAEAVRVRIEAVKKFKAEGLSVDETCEKVAGMFGDGGTREAYEGFRVREASAAGQRRWVVHQYHVTGGNISWE